jgi:hypothetical protein
MAHFSGNYPVTFTQARLGEVVVAQGYGSRPMVWRPSAGAFRQAGLDAPTDPPKIAIDESDSFYVARVDLRNPGSGYTRPPIVEVDPPEGAKANAAPGPVRRSGRVAADGPRQATAITRIRSGFVSEVEVTDHGRLYTATPNVKVIDSSGVSPASISITLDGEAASDTSIVVWEKVYNGTGWACDPPSGGYWPATGGSGSGAAISITDRTATTSQGGLLNCASDESNPANVSEVTPSVEVFKAKGGTGYLPTDEVTANVTTANSIYIFLGNVIKRNCGAGCPIVFRGYPVGHPRAGTQEEVAFRYRTTGMAVKSINVHDGGSGYGANTVVRILPYAGAPAWMAEVVKANVIDGRIVSVDLPRSKYVFQPVAEIGEANSTADLIAIMRATFRGKYQCYYRFVDKSVPESEGGPRYTSLSPVTEIDAGDSSSSLAWVVPTPPDGLTVELWRSSSNQATTLYRVAELPEGATEYTDQLNDNELTDPNRDGFLAMPILLPNGELNANRFGVPPSDYAVAVMFQDRLWMGVDTTGTRPNHLRFSEMDEPESMPDVNEIIIQQNLRAGDYVTALIPYAGALVVCQSRHSHRLTYVSQPLVDVGVFMLAYRGCLNQRCWDIYEGRAYVMDEQGVYSLDPQGQVDGLTVGLDDLFQSKIDWTKSRWFLVRADRKLNVLRCSVAYKGDEGKYPTRQLVYSLDFKAWWEERHPQILSSATDCRTSTGEMALVYGSASGKCYRLGQGLTDDAVGAIAEVQVTHPGRGYRRPPKITASGGSGAEFSCALSADGQIVGIQVRHCGTGYKSGSLTISEPEDGGEPAQATYTVADGEIPVHYTIRTGNMEFVTDEQDKRGGEYQGRQVSVVYQPTRSKTILNLEAYYNGASYPRSNVVARNRGVGFSHSDSVPAATLDMQATPLQNAESHGVARALFAGRTLDDMAGTDRHIAIGLSGKQDNAGSVVVHSVDVYGVNSAS